MNFGSIEPHNMKFQEVLQTTWLHNVCLNIYITINKYHTHKINELTKQPRLSGYYTEKAMVELVVTIVASKNRVNFHVSSKNKMLHEKSWYFDPENDDLSNFLSQLWHPNLCILSCFLKSKFSPLYLHHNSLNHIG